MTAPTITYGPGYLNECDSVTSWVECCSLHLQPAGYVDCIAGDIGKQVADDGANIGALQSYDNTNHIWYVNTTSLVVAASNMTIAGGGTGAGTSKACIISAARTFSTNGDVFTLSATPSDATVGNLEELYVQLDVANFSQTTYPNLKIRFKTSRASEGLQPTVRVIFADDSISTHALGFSTTWKVSTVTPTSGTSTTISKIELSAVEYAATPNNASSVYYDFALFYQGTFTFPYVGKGGVRVSGHNRYVDHKPPGFSGELSDWLGTDNQQIEIIGDMDTNVNWAPLAAYTTSPDTVPGDIFFALHHKAWTELWQWLDCSMFEGKVTFRDFWIEEPSEDNARYRYHLVFKEERLSSATSEDWFERNQFV